MLNINILKGFHFKAKLALAYFFVRYLRRYSR